MDGSKRNFDRCEGYHQILPSRLHIARIEEPLARVSAASVLRVDRAADLSCHTALEFVDHVECEHGRVGIDERLSRFCVSAAAIVINVLRKSSHP
jgi:hypothetical protein